MAFCGDVGSFLIPGAHLRGALRRQSLYPRGSRQNPRRPHNHRNRG
jgi:hypothetical protein